MFNRQSFQALDTTGEVTTPPKFQRRKQSLISEQEKIALPPLGKQGYLLSEAKKGQWTKQYYMVKGGHMFFYEHKEKEFWELTSGAQAAISPEVGPTVRDPDTNYNVSYKYMFTITVNGEQLALGCQNPSTRRSWINILTLPPDELKKQKKGCIGYLMQRRKGKWQRTFFTLFGNRLAIHETKVKGSVSLLDGSCEACLHLCTVIDPDTTRPAVCFPFLVTSGKKSYKLVAKSDRARMEWVDVITSVISWANFCKVSPNSSVALVAQKPEATVTSDEELAFIHLMLTSRDISQQRAAACAYAHISTHGSNRLMIAAEGTPYVSSIVNLSQTACDVEVLTECARILHNLVITPRTRPSLMEAGIMTALAHLMESPIQNVQCLALGMLKTLLLDARVSAEEASRFAPSVTGVLEAVDKKSPVKVAAKEVSKLLSHVVPRVPAPVFVDPAPAPVAPVAPAAPLISGSPSRALRPTDRFNIPLAPGVAPSPVKMKPLISFTPPRPTTAPTFDADDVENFGTFRGANNGVNDSFDVFMSVRAAAYVS